MSNGLKQSNKYKHTYSYQYHKLFLTWHDLFVLRMQSNLVGQLLSRYKHISYLVIKSVTRNKNQRKTSNSEIRDGMNFFYRLVNKDDKFEQDSFRCFLNILTPLKSRRHFVKYFFHSTQNMHFQLNWGPYRAFKRFYFCFHWAAALFKCKVFKAFRVFSQK